MEVQFDLNGLTIRVLDGVYSNGNTETAAAQEFARHLFSQLAEMKEYAAQHLMDTYDSLWPEDEHQVLTQSEFAAHLTSPKIIIGNKTGAASVYFDEDGIFRDDFSVKVTVRNRDIVDVSLE